MKKKYLITVYFFVVIALSGCTQVTELTKVFWGSSTDALEEARLEAIVQSYQCDVDECFDAIVNLQRPPKSPFDNSIVRAEKENSPGHFDIFIEDRVKSLIVVMGIKGNVDTTEVGIFLTPRGSKTVEVEIASLSTSAKEKIADIIFLELNKQFSEANS